MMKHNTCQQNTAIGNSCHTLEPVELLMDTAIGNQSMVDVTGNYNTALGFQTLFDMTSGNSNIK